MAAAESPTRPPRKAVSRGAVVGVSVVGLSLVIGASVVVGFVGHPDGFGWELASVFGTALGTTLLALSTGALAFLTYREVGATQELAELTRADQVNRARPVVVRQLVEYRAPPDYPESYVAVEVVNVGLSPAFNIELKATYEPDPRLPIESFRIGALQPGTPMPVALRPDPDRLARMKVDPDGFSASGTYTDRARQQRHDVILTWSTGHVRPEPDGVEPSS